MNLFESAVEMLSVHSPVCETCGLKLFENNQVLLFCVHGRALIATANCFVCGRESPCAFVHNSDIPRQAVRMEGQLSFPA